MMMTESDFELNPFHARVLRFVDRNGLAVNEVEGDPFSLLISIGYDDGATEDQRVVVFELGEEILDPDTGMSLGRFEIIKGEGKISSLQARMSIIKSQRMVLELKDSPYIALASVTGQDKREYRRVPAPFSRPKIGDFVRFI